MDKLCTFYMGMESSRLTSNQFMFGKEINMTT